MTIGYAVRSQSIGLEKTTPINCAPTLHPITIILTVLNSSKQALQKTFQCFFAPMHQFSVTAQGPRAPLKGPVDCGQTAKATAFIFSHQMHQSKRIYLLKYCVTKVKVELCAPNPPRVPKGGPPSAAIFQ